jgi:thymidylate synthase (FAD)
LNVVKSSFEVLTRIDIDDIYGSIERAGRTAYKSGDKITFSSSVPFVRSIIRRGHESVLEHYSISVRFICDRGVSHEIVRHRLCAFTQESTRYCNYSKKGVTFIQQPFWSGTNRTEMYVKWLSAMENAEAAYNYLIEHGASPQEARSVLPNSLKTEIVVTANIREWRHILRIRTPKSAHPQMRELMIPLLQFFHETVPALFQDIPIPEDY